jgi:hypothetical protein
MPMKKNVGKKTSNISAIDLDIYKKENESLKMRIRVLEMEENFYQEKIKELEEDIFDLKNEIVEIQTSIGRLIF